MPNDMLNTKLTRERWTLEEDEKIKRLINLYGSRWTKVIATSFPSRSSAAVRKRWHKIAKDSWSIREDEELINIVNGTHFETKAEMKDWWEAAFLMIPNKSVNMCVDHWFDLLRPSSTTPKWEVKEDQKLAALYYLYGPKWKMIAKLFPRRTDKMLRRRWIAISKNKQNDDRDLNAAKSY